MKAKENARVTTVIAVDPATAFAVFTEEIGAWWRPKVRDLFREGRTGVMKFEPGPNGRLVEVYADAPEDLFEVGRVLTWIPGERLVFEWRQRGFRPRDMTHVEVRFEAVEQGTRVTLEHRGWDSFPPEHPARHGWTGEAFVSMIGLRWGDQLTSLAAHLSRRHRE
jgi:uncharacterized protein YndB with AHSA1/START domain